MQSKVKIMHILHIANSYGGTEVYKQLIEALDKLCIKQTVFVPLNPNNLNRNGNFIIDFQVHDSVIIYSTNLKHYHRYLYGLKINKIVKTIEKQVDLQNVDVIHAGLFCSDGAAAYELSKKYSIPYLVAVRNTDVNVYYKKMWWKRTYFQTILRESNKIIFISHQYKNLFLSSLKCKENDYLEKKSIVIPNGLNRFYLDNQVHKAKSIHFPIRVIYAGAFNKGKNILESLNALQILVKKGYFIEFTAIGRGLKFRKEEKEYLNKLFHFASDKKWIHILDSLPKEELRKAFEASDIFLMPSTPETFGIVYLEALSQGMPIIYAKDQGFDGYYKEQNIGFGVDPKNSYDIASKIEIVINNYSQLAKNVYGLDLYNDFSWEKISAVYLKLYLNTKIK